MNAADVALSDRIYDRIERMAQENDKLFPSTISVAADDIVALVRAEPAEPNAALLEALRDLAQSWKPLPRGRSYEDDYYYVGRETGRDEAREEDSAELLALIAKFSPPATA